MEAPTYRPWTSLGRQRTEAKPTTSKWRGLCLVMGRGETIQRSCGTVRWVRRDPRRHRLYRTTWTRSAERATEFAVSMGIDSGVTTLHATYDELVADDSLDIVYVATPSLRHVDDSLRCLRAGRAVLCEKSMAPSAGSHSSGSGPG